MGQLIYCYDAYCGWCFAFGPVLERLARTYRETIHVEVLSGGMILPASPTAIEVIAPYLKASYKEVEAKTAVKFGQDYLWHILNPAESDWFPDSTKPAVALSIFKEIYPALQVILSKELQQALFIDGRDLCDNEAYRHILDQYAVDSEDFYSRLASEEYLEKAKYEFELVQKLRIPGFPALLYQESDSKFHLLSHGYTDFETVNQRLNSVTG